MGQKLKKIEFSSFHYLFLLRISHTRPFVRESLAYESPVNSKLSPISRFPLNFSMNFEERADVSSISATLCGRKIQKKWVFLFLQSIFTWNFPYLPICERELGIWMARELKTPSNFPFPSEFLNEFRRESQYLFDKCYPMWKKNSKNWVFV